LTLILIAEEGTALPYPTSHEQLDGERQRGPAATWNSSTSSASTARHRKRTCTHYGGGSVFSILISNTDDHLRNHGFLWTGPAGWRLSPAYDLNPVPTDIKPRVLTTAIDLDERHCLTKSWRSKSPAISN